MASQFVLVPALSSVSCRRPAPGGGTSKTSGAPRPRRAGRRRNGAAHGLRQPAALLVADVPGGIHQLGDAVLADSLMSMRIMAAVVEESARALASSVCRCWVGPRSSSVRVAGSVGDAARVRRTASDMPWTACSG